MVRALFWRRKNARLATRLNTLVETSERARKTRRRAPSRVVIDTSYVEQADAKGPSPAQELNDAEGQDGLYEHVVYETADPSATYAADDYQPQTEAASDYDGSDPEHHDDEASILLREAIEQLDHAEAGQAEALEREAAALKEIEAQRERLDALEAGLADANVARAQAEQALENEQNNVERPAPAATSAKRDAELEQDLETHRAMVESLSADLRHEQKTRAQTNGDLKAANARAAAAELKLDELRDTEADYNKAKADATAAKARAAAAEKDVETSHERCQALEAELGEARSARAAAEDASATAEKLIKEREQQIETLEQAARDAAALEQRAADAEAETADVRVALQTAQDDVTALTEKAAGYERTCAELSDVTAELAEAQRHAKQCADREATVRDELAAQQATNENLEAELEAVRKSIADVETAHADRVAALDSEIVELRDAAAEQGDDAEARVTAAREEAETQHAAVARLEADLKAQREALDDVETDKEMLTARAAASERRLVETQSAAAETEAKLRAEIDALREASVASNGESDTAGGHDQAAFFGEDNADPQRTVAGERARAVQLENERDVLRRQLAEVQRAADAAMEQVRDGELELADLRQAVAEQASAEEERAEAPERETAVRQELEAERGRLDDIVAELEQERAARTEAETRLNEALKQAAEEGSETPDSFAVGGTVELEPAEAEPPQKPQEETATDLVIAKMPDVPAPTVLSELASPVALGAKRSNRIAGKSDTNSVSSAALHATGPTARLGSVIQNRIAKATAKKEDAKEHRRAKRVASRKLASLWQDGMSAPLSCTMLDRSSTGAKLEVLTDRFNDRMNEISVGDRFMVTQTYAHERTSVTCEIMWVNGQRCGVRFCGQIHTEIQKPAKKALPKQSEKPSTSSAIKSLFGAGTR
ncbi:MAG: PilZ domain-containing protein [Hyphomicrobiaceae bacterium]